jgi:hypothetical protein
MQSRPVWRPADASEDDSTVWALNFQGSSSRYRSTTVEQGARKAVARRQHKLGDSDAKKELNAFERS